MGMRNLPRDFYDRDTIQVAVDLIGKLLVHQEDGWSVCGRIVETEAYLGAVDPASHLGGKRIRSPKETVLTGRVERSWGQPGHAYVFLCYGIHACLNAVTLSQWPFGCVLIRAVEPVNHGDDGYQPVTDRTDGPGRLTRAMGIDIGHDGADLTRGPIMICEPGEERDIPSPLIESAPRVGISTAKDLGLRFYDANSRHVSG